MISSYLIAPILAWLAAQGAKYLLSGREHGQKRRVSRLYETGGMPSSHTAIVIALMTAIGYKEGIDSASFAIATGLAVIVIHDALQVRRASGEQGQAVVQLLKKAGIKLTPHQALGHKPSEVIVGGIVGFISAGIALYF